MKWSERLGYRPDEKVVIIHADDAGITSGTNKAIQDLFKKNILQSCSVFANSSATDHFLDIHDSNWDIGLHFNFRPVLDKKYHWGNFINLLEDKTSKLFHLISSSRFADIFPFYGDSLPWLTGTQVRKELESQWNSLTEQGLKLSHIDCHNGTLYFSKRLVRVYLNLLSKKQAAGMVLDPTPENIKSFPLLRRLISLYDEFPNFFRLDKLFILTDVSSYSEKLQALQDIIASINPGLTEIIVHPSSVIEESENKFWDYKALLEIFGNNNRGLVFTNWGELNMRFNGYGKNTSV